MPHHVGDHDRVSLGADAIILTQAQMEDLKAFFTDLHERDRAETRHALSDAQFDQIAQLLQPVHELAVAQLKMMGQSNTNPALNPPRPQPTTSQPAYSVGDQPSSTLHADMAQADRDPDHRFTADVINHGYLHDDERPTEPLSAPRPSDEKTVVAPAHVVSPATPGPATSRPYGSPPNPNLAPSPTATSGDDAHVVPDDNLV